MNKLIFASNNKGKIKEVKEIFKNSDFEIISLLDLNIEIDIEEHGSTFVENALIKAEEIFNIYKTPVIADDSGLSVDYLNGAPGVYSKRFAGKNGDDDQNINKLLDELKKFNPPYKAKFVCAAVYKDENKTVTAIGEFHGEIIFDRRGNNGFGYDPVFVPNDYSKTLAELSSEEKNKISHRAIAFNKLMEMLSK